MENKYIISKEYIIFSPFFNEKITDEIFNGEKVIFDQIKKIIFSNYSFGMKKVCIKKKNKGGNYLSHFNKFIKIYPPNLEILIFGWKFNKSIDNLPEKLKYLRLDECFNQPINNLPSSIVELVLGGKFNQSLDYLPSSIINLTIDEKLINKLNNIPSSINEIKLKTLMYDHENNKFNKYSKKKYETELKKISQTMPNTKIFYIENDLVHIIL